MYVGSDWYNCIFFKEITKLQAVQTTPRKYKYDIPKKASDINEAEGSEGGDGNVNDEVWEYLSIYIWSLNLLIVILNKAQHLIGTL